MHSTKRLWTPEARARKHLKLGPNTILAIMRHGCSILTATISRSFIRAKLIFIVLMLNGPFPLAAACIVSTYGGATITMASRKVAESPRSSWRFSGATRSAGGGGMNTTKPRLRMAQLNTRTQRCFGCHLLDVLLARAVKIIWIRVPVKGLWRSTWG